jgi:hypothetical protein
MRPLVLLDYVVKLPYKERMRRLSEVSFMAFNFVHQRRWK